MDNYSEWDEIRDRFRREGAKEYLAKNKELEKTITHLEEKLTVVCEQLLPNQIEAFGLSKWWSTHQPFLTLNRLMDKFMEHKR